MALNVSLPTPIAVILIPSDLYDFRINLTAFASAGSPSDNVRKISGFFDVKTGSILSYTSANGVPPFAEICANLLAAELFHFISAGFTNQQTTCLSTVLNAYTEKSIFKNASTSQSPIVAFLYSIC